MNVRLFGPAPAADDRDEALSVPAASKAEGTSFASAVKGAFASADAALAGADSAERAFASGRGGMQEMVLERAQADIALSIASAAASRAAQSLSTILGMQI